MNPKDAKPLSASGVAALVEHFGKIGTAAALGLSSVVLKRISIVAVRRIGGEAATGIIKEFADELAQIAASPEAVRRFIRDEFVPEIKKHLARADLKIPVEDEQLEALGEAFISSTLH